VQRPPDPLLRALAIAGQICVYTNDKITLEKLSL